MENQDTLYKQFQQASQKAEGKDFPAMDKVWARVEDKLDHKVLKNENKLWKKIAVAASFLLLFTLGYQFFKDDSESIVPETSVVLEEIETIKTETPINENNDQETTPTIVNSAKAKEIIQEKIVTEQAVAVVENDASTTQNEVLEESAAKSFETDKTEVHQNRKKEKSGGYFNAPTYDAVSVKSSFVEKQDNDGLAEEQVVKKPNPLLVVDGKAVVNRNDDNLDTLLKKSNTRNEDVELIKVLAAPLYIINGTEYSEEELFGKNPTSPYYPLDKQEIISTKILLEDEAMAVYGEKGKKGVVIISTRNGKPLKK